MKYYEMRTYTLKPGTVKQYIKYFEEIGRPIITKYLKLVGFWYTELGTLNQLVSIWEYESLDEGPKSAKLFIKMKNGIISLSLLPFRW